MDFNRFKPGQLKCITTLDAPLVVSAGAGSGKTFTLTQRIAWALMEGSAEDGGAFLDGIEQVMAITFTEKAAGEIKSRVKSTLRAEGMASEALKVDDAWISTIHGMCSRILRMHAVELGIDPSFSVLDPARSDELIRASVAQVLSGANEFVSPQGLDALFAEFPARSSGGFSSDSVEDMLVELVRVASGNPRGFDAFRLPPRARDASALVRLLVQEIESARDIASSQKQSASRDTWLAQAEDFIEGAIHVQPSSMSVRELLAFCDRCPWPSGRFGSSEYKEIAGNAQASCAEVIQEIRCLASERLLDDLLRIGRSAFDAYRDAKKQRAVLDNDDLLIQAAAALVCHDDIAREFADKFKIIMVDEFQDTDQLQIDMISRMAGAGGKRLCTVGDSQQSIYRFRGADVQVYKRHLAKIKSTHPDGLIELPDNFRSHGDVLHFVDRVFEQDHVFGDEFMSLSASRFESSVKKPFRGNDTRVNVMLTTYPARRGIDASEVTRFEARRIVERFSELRDRGHAPGDMVILLGRMTRAGIFADALREAGFACVIAGGSIFSSAPEVRIMRRLIEVIANPHATASLFELLSSEMFVLSADDFIMLSTMFDKDRQVFRRRGIDVGFDDLAQCIEAGESDASACLVHAVRVVKNLSLRVGSMPVSRIMMKAVEESGWLTRLESLGAEGQSVAGNVMKAIRIVESFEKDGVSGAASIAQSFVAYIETAKEAPGALSAQGGDFVRIMTVHASKGLEFPIVAVAEMAQTNARTPAFRCNTIDGVSFVGLDLRRSLSRFSSTSPIKKAMDKKYGVGCLSSTEGETESSEAVLSAPSPMAQREAIRIYEAEQELQERRRLLYVGLTRAKEALIVSMSVARSPSSDGSGITAESGVYDDIRSALFAHGDIPEGTSMVDFGGSLPAIVCRIDTDESDFEEGSSSQADGDSVSFCEASVDAPSGIADAQAVSGDVRPAAWDGASCSDASEQAGGCRIAVPALAADGRMSEVPLGSERFDTASYSALAAEVEDAVFDEPVPVANDSVELIDDGDAFPDDSCEGFACDADRATDFGAAFHLCAQQAVCLADSLGGTLRRPSDKRLASVIESCGLGQGAKRRLEVALDRWFESDIARMCESADAMTAELPFFIDLGRGCDSDPFRIAYLEGSIDLFVSWNCTEEGGAKRAAIVDYKTGGSPGESQRELYTKHLLQASCYAYAALMRGFDSVEAYFVRVEQHDAANPRQPEVVRYSFESEDTAVLFSRIDEACRRLEEKRAGRL
ncbi:MAG: UvrD-helicase domain-containing protein [Slackia sp.]|nr:UvrD-helicase domain-containing protein [Slackia sp.]